MPALEQTRSPYQVLIPQKLDLEGEQGGLSSPTPA